MEPPLSSICINISNTKIISHTDASSLYNRMKSFAKLKHPSKTIVEQMIINSTIHLSGAILKQRLWHIINNVDTIPTCTQCNNPVKWEVASSGYRPYCSSKCKGADLHLRERTKATVMAKYGTASSSQNPAVNAKIRATANAKDASDWARISAARQKTFRERYGVDTYSQTDVWEQKIKATNLSKYGTEFYSQSAQGKKQVVNTWKNKNKEQIDELTEKRANTFLYRYGVSNASQYLTFYEKAKSTLASNYGLSNPTYTMNNPIKYVNLNTEDWLHQQHVTDKKSIQHIAIELDTTGGTVKRYLNKHSIPFTPMYYSSVGERQIGQFLSDNQIDHITNDRTIIHPKELDIYIPQLKLAIEYCGLYWHSEQRGKTRSYHKNKHDMCAKQGIQLLTIFEDEWFNTPELVKNKLLHLVGKSTAKLYARKLTIKSLTPKQKRDFFDANHLQGNGPGSICYGLFNADNLVAAMAFINQGNNQFALNRYATNIHVVGGFSKLLAHFKKHQQWNQIISFADQRWSNGNLYKQNGFILDSVIAPDYYYSPDGCTRYHKFNYRRKNLPKLLTTFDPALSEWENCKANDVLKLWDCGKQRWVINKYITPLSSSDDRPC